MIAQLTNLILDTLRAHGAGSVFVGVLIEQVIIPIPSPAIIMGAGLILVPADAAWFSAFVDITLKIVFPGVLASALGAWGTYYLGLWGGKWFVDKFHNYLGFDWNDVERMGKKMTASGTAASLFFMRALPIVPLSLVSIVAGVMEVPVSRFLVWSVLGTVPRCYVLAVLGWMLGSNAMKWAKGVDRFESIVSLLLVLLLLGGILYIRRRVRGELKT